MKCKLVFLIESIIKTCLIFSPSLLLQGFGMKTNMFIYENCETMWGEILDNSHIFQCKKLNTNTNNLYIEKTLNGYLNEKKEHLKIWRKNMEKR